MNLRLTQRARPSAPAVPAEAPSGAEFPPDVRAAMRRLAVLSGLCIALAVIFPFPITKAVIVAIIAAPLAGELFVRPPVAMAFIALFLPVLDLLPPLPVPGLNAQTFVSFAAIIGTVRLRSSQSTTPAPVPYAGLFWALAGLTTFEMMLTLTTTRRIPAMEVITLTKSWIGYFPLFFFAARAARESWARKLILAAVVISASGCALHSVAMFIIKGGGERLRSTGLVGNQPNIYGGYLAMVLPLLVALALNGTGGKLTRLMAAGGAWITGLALIFAKSRGGWVAFAGAMLVMIVLKRQMKLLVLCIVLVAFAGSLLPSAFWDRLDDTWSEESTQYTESGYDASTQSRINQWEGFPTMFWDSPLWGHGLWTFGDVIYDFGLYNRRISPHSSILRFGVEYGVLGLALYFTLMLRLLFGAVGTSKVAVGQFDKSLAVGMVGSFAALLISDTTGARFFNDEIFAVFCILAGIISAAMASQPAPSAPRVPTLKVAKIKPVAAVRRG